MDYEHASPGQTHTAAATLEAQLLNYSENAENEGEDEEYLEEEVLQVRTGQPEYKILMGPCKY